MRSKFLAFTGVTLMAAAGAAFAYATTGTTAPEPAEGYVCPATGETLPCPDCCPLNTKPAAKVDCCDDPACPPGCSDDCPPDGADAKPKVKKSTCPPCPFCP